MSMEARKLTIAVLTLLLLCTAKADAAVLFVIPEYSSNSIALVNKTNRHLGTDIDIKTIVDVDPLDTEQYKAIVLVGSTVLTQWPGSSIPTIAILVSTKQVSKHKQSLATSIYADPPLARQVLLAIELLGAKQPIGILLKTDSSLLNTTLPTSA